MSAFRSVEHVRPPGAGSFRILTVCTGNICRSPLAEALLRDELVALDVDVRSAGTHARQGEPMSGPTAEIALTEGVAAPERHRARQLEIGELAQADLVLALAREHRRSVVELLPGAARRTFTLREFARLTATLSITPTGTEPAARLRAAVDELARLRGTVPPPADVADDEVIDPYRRSAEVYAASAAQLVPAVRATARFLTLVSSARSLHA